MTKGEFEQGYAQRSGITVARLHELGRYAVPCDCGHEDCKGWQMKHRTLLSYDTTIDRLPDDPTIEAVRYVATMRIWKRP